MWFVRFKHAVCCILLPLIISLIIQMSGRIYLFFDNVTTDIYEKYAQDIIKMFKIGLLFDIRVASILFALLFILGLLLSFTNKTYHVYKKIYLILGSFFTTVIGYITIVNVFYFKTYGRPIDVFIFGLIDDDTKAIIITMWKDYPVVRILGGTALIFIVMYKLLKIWQKKCLIFNRVLSLPVSIIATIVIMGTVFIGMRGSVGVFPLRRNDTQVSDAKLINALTANGGMSFDWALADYKRKLFKDVTVEEGQKLFTQFLGNETNPELNVFIKKTDENAENNHVVILVMESMGEHLFTFDTEDRNMYGELKKHWDSDIRFKRFAAEGNGTLDSLMRLILRSPMDYISQSTAQSYEFKSNMLKPYIDSGYKIIFVTSGNGSWRNLNNFLPEQGVDIFVEQNMLKKLYPDAKSTEWGVPDKYMFSYIENYLKSASKDEKLLIIGLSITFHPPYRVPEDVPVKNFNLTAKEQERLANLTVTGGSLDEILTVFSYTNDQLGHFLTNIKSSALANNTIIAITGDHNTRSIGYSDEAETFFEYAVPFYMYVPEKIKKNLKYNPYRAASHKDIFPTINNLVLSDVEYFSTGCNLFSEKSDSDWCFGFNADIIFDDDGVYRNNGYSRWKGDSLLLDEVVEYTSSQKEWINKKIVTEKLLQWMLNKQVMDNKNK